MTSSDSKSLKQAGVSGVLADVVNHVIDLDPELWEDLTILVPTQRMATHLLAALTDHKQACWAPEVFTFDSWLQRRYAAQTAPTLSPWQEETILSWILDSQDFKHLQSSHGRELLLLFQEVGTYDTADQGWELLKNRLLRDIYRDPDALDILQQRVDEIVLCRQLWLQAIDQSGHQSRYQQKWDMARMAISEAKTWNQKFPGHQLIMTGFTSLQPAPLSVLQTLGALDNAHVFLSQPAETADTAPLRQIYDALGAKLQPRRSLPKTPPHHVVQLTDPVAECQFVAQQIQTVIHEGTPPSQIGVLVTNDRIYVDLLRQALDDFQITERNFGMGQQLQQTMLGGALTILRSLQSPSNHYCATFVQALHHPLIASVLQDMADLEPPAYELVVTQLVHGFTRLPLINGFEDLTHAKVGKTAKRHLMAWKDLLAPTQWLADSSLKSLGDRLAFTERWLSKLHEHHRSHWAARDVEQAAIDLSRKYFQGFLEHQKHWNCSHSQWWSWWDEHLLTIEVRAVGEPLSGVQILSVEEARNIPFTLTFVLGAQENCMPKALPKDDLMDDFLKRAMGLPGWAALESMEEQNFWLLMELSRCLVFTWSQRAQNLEQVRSRFIDAGIQKGWITDHRSQPSMPLNSSLPEPTIAAVLDREVSLQFSTPPEPWLNHMSASALTQFIQCPFRFALSRQKGEPLELPKGSMNAAAEGSWVHRILQSFFLDPDTAEESAFDEKRDFLQRTVARLDSLTKQHASPGALDCPLYAHLLRFAWPAFARHMNHVFEGDWRRMRAQQHKEAKLKSGEGHNEAYTSQSPQLKGSIDSLDLTTGPLILTDYKRGSSLPTAMQIKNGTAPQLSFYVQAILQGWTDLDTTEQTDFVAGYWSVKDGNWHPRLVHGPDQTWAMQRQLVKKNAPRADEAIAAMNGLWDWRLESARSKESSFVADTSQCGHCPQSGICRKHDAAFSDALEQQTSLKTKLQDDTEESSHE